jgi:hypothetical protein
MKWIKSKYDEVLNMFSKKFPISEIDLDGKKRIAATDGISLIAIEKNLLYDCYSKNEKFPKMDKIFKEIENNPRKETFFSIESLEKILNKQTKFVEKIEKANKRDCPACDGNGSFPCWHCEHQISCSKCDGNGFIEDLFLTGKKIADENSEIFLQFSQFNCFFSYHQIKRIIDCLKKTEIDQISHIAGDINTVNLFVSKNSEFLLYIMPLRKKDHQS